jgi:DNA-binding beta-propeller fold protein YncE
MNRLVVLAVLLLAGQRSQSARVYFTDQPPGVAGSIVSVAPDGTGQATVLTTAGVSDLRGIGYHSAGGRIYFLDNGPAKKIYSVLPNGTAQQEITPLGWTFNADLEIDEASSKVYWAETANGSVMRANLNGTTVEPVATPGAGTYTAPYFIFVDAAGGYLYWGVTGDSGTSNFRRSTLGGAIDPDFLITSASRTRDIAVDPTTATAYWCDRQTGSVFKRAVNGGANQTVISGMNAPHGIALDVEAEKVYWADTGARGNPPQGLSARRVARCNFDGTQFENLSTPTPTSEPWDLTLDLASRTYGDWRQRFFSTNAPAAGPNDDPDSDGASNLLEYAMGTHPNKLTSVPRVTAEGIAMRYTRRRGSNLGYRVEVSTDLVVWHYNGDGGGTWVLHTSPTPLGPELETVTARGGPALSGATRVSFRLRVTMP